MSLASIVQDDRFELGFLRSIDDAGGKAQQLVALNGAYRTRNLDMKGMGGNAQINDLGLMTMLANKSMLTLCGEVVSYEDVRTREQQLKIDLVRAFGSEIAAMGNMVVAVMEALADGSPLSVEQKEQLLAVMNEMVTLKNMTNIGAIEGGQERLEAMVAETANKLADLLIDGLDQDIVPQALADFVRDFLSDVAETYDLPDIEAKIIQIDRMMDPQIGLREVVAEVIQTLTERLESDDLDEEERAEIESVLETLQDAMEKDAPIHNTVITALDDLIDKYPDIAKETGLTAQVLELKVANGEVKTALIAAVDRVAPIETSGAKTEQKLSLKETAMALVAANSNMPQISNSTVPEAPSVVTPLTEAPIATPIMTSEAPAPITDRAVPTTPDIAEGRGEIPSTPKSHGEPTPEPFDPPENIETNPKDEPRQDPVPESEKDVQEPPRHSHEDDVLTPTPDEQVPENSDGDNKDREVNHEKTPAPDEPSEPESCGYGCKCKDKYNQAAGNNGNEGASKDVVLELTNPDGTKVEHKIPQENWDKVVEQYGGDVKKAEEHIASEIKKDQGAIKIVEKKLGTNETENKQLDDSIRQARAALKNGTSFSTTPPQGDGAKKQFGHVCGANCHHDHGTKTEAKNEIKSSGFKSKKGGKTPKFNNV